MKKWIVLIAVMLSFAVALPEPADATCWKCVEGGEGPYCDDIPWNSYNYSAYHTNCSQTYRCLGGVCFAECYAFGSQCTFWDVWF